MRDLIERLGEAEMERFLKGQIGSILPRLYKSIKEGDRAGILQNAGALVRTMASAPAMTGDHRLSSDVDKVGNDLLAAARKR